MKSQSRTAALSVRADLVPSKGNISNLRSAVAFSTPGVKVDAEAGVIRGAAVMNVGPAVGHGFNIDLETLRQVEALGNATPGGVKVRFKHPGIDEDGQQIDDLGSVIGFVDALRIDGDSLRGDVHIEDYAKLLPGEGNVRDYLLARASTRPDSFGLSCVIGWDAEVVADATGQPTSLVARVFALDAIDVVGRGAATPNGLLSAVETKPTQPVAGALLVAPIETKPATAALSGAASHLKGRSLMDPKTKQYLSANHGLAAGATDEEAQAMLDALNPEAKAAMSAKLAEQPTDGKAPSQMAARRSATDAGDEFLALEGKRVAQLQQLGNTLNVDKAVIQLAIAEGDDVIKGRTRYLKALQEACPPVKGAVTIEVGKDQNFASLSAAIPDALRIKAQCAVKDPKPRALELSQLKFIQIGRNYLAACGVQDAQMINDMKVWEMLVRPHKFAGQYSALAQSGGSFTNIVLDAANKTLRQAYLDKPATWTMWARRASTPDFKNVNRISLSDAPGLVSRQEGGEIKYANMSDGKETYVVTEYVNGIRLTRQAVVNDDMDAFGRIPMLQGNAARRKEDDVAYAILTANAAMADTGLLFNATAVTTAGGHANLDSATANVGAPSIATLGLGRKAMRLQKGPKGAVLNLVPRYLIVPAALETVAYQFTSVTYTPALATNVNPFGPGGATVLTPIIEPRLDANSSVIWYLAADNAQIDTVEVCFLADEPEPQLKQETDFDTDDLKFAVRHTLGAKAIDFRGLYSNAGA
jgi:hypothetical protein